MKFLQTKFILATAALAAGCDCDAELALQESRIAELESCCT